MKAHARDSAAPSEQRFPAGAKWVRERLGRTIPINWARWLSGLKPVDPYLVWADVSRFVGFDTSAGEESGGRWPFLIEMAPSSKPYLLPPHAAATCDAFAAMEIPGFYKTALSAPVGQTPPLELASRFITARVSPASIEQLLYCPEVQRIQLGLPRIPETDVEQQNTAVQTMGTVPRTVIGVIDDGCAFAHPAFCDAKGSTRVHFLWDQDPSRKANRDGWLRPARVGYGAELWHDELCKASRAAFGAHSDESAYKKVNYGPTRLDIDRRTNQFVDVVTGLDLPMGRLARFAHGTSTMYLAAGLAPDARERRPLRQQRATITEDSHPPDENPPAAAASADSARDHASRWPIIFVQLPTYATLDTSGGSLGVHVLDGIRYIIDRAQCIPEDKPELAAPPLEDTGSRNSIPETADALNQYRASNRVIINISYGAGAGPHDGTSILEQAMADLVQVSDQPSKWGSQAHTWLCVAAGNLHKSRSHARLHLAPGQRKSLAWQVPPDNPLQSFLEIWLPHVDSGGACVTEADRDRLSIQVTPPGGYPTQQVRPGQLWTCELGDDGTAAPRVVAGAVYARRVSQGTLGTMVLLAAAATRPRLGRDDPMAPHGTWLVEVGNADSSATGLTGRDLIVDAWVSRNDLLFGTARLQQSTVEAEEPARQPTEFTPTALRYGDDLRGGRFLGPIDNAFTVNLSSGSVAGIRSARVDGRGTYPFQEHPVSESGHVVNVGAYRLADVEVTDYSSGGPHRHLPEQGASALAGSCPADDVYTRTSSEPTQGPDAQAPADIGPALRGLRTIGTRAGSVARLSGTSAAAPSMARLIANVQHTYSWNMGNVGNQDNASAVAAVARSHGADQPERKRPTGDSDAARPTAMPKQDDLYRRGRWRLR